MNQIKKLKIALSLVTIGLSILPVVALAQIDSNRPGNFALSLSTLGNTIITQVWVAFTIVAVICFVIAGILFLTSAGDPEKIKNARNAFLWGVVGVIVGVVAYTIVALVRGSVGAGSSTI